MKNVFYILILLVFTPVITWGQTSEETIFDEAAIIYEESFYGGGLLHTNGWGAHVTWGKGLTAFKSRILQLEIVEMKHTKEVRAFNPYYEDSRSYVFGKQNSFFVIRPTFGIKKVKFDKIRKSGVAIGYNWRVGPSLGFTKPVYLEIGDSDSPPFRRITVEKYDPEVHTVEMIFGRAGLLRGINELRIHPGLHGAFGINFEYAPDRASIKGLEIGMTVDYYPLNEIEIMAFSDNYNLFVNFYLTLQFGKKFNR
ncbi:MAG: hypothetical protein ABR574_05145 [Cryomorphaceae bacterium]